MAEKVGIEIELMNADYAERTLHNIENSVKRLGSKKTMIRLEDGSLVSVEERIKNIQDRLAALDSAKKMGVITPSEVQEAKKLSAELKVISRGLKDGVSQAEAFKRAFNSMSSQIAHFGGSMQTLGNAMVRLTSPFSRLTGGLLMGAGYKALNLFTEGISNSFERADTMNNYDRTLSKLGMNVAKTFSVAGKEAMTARENLDEAVQGLPTSLDEIMEKQKIYAGASGEMVESTKTAIAANNTALASGMDARSQLYMQRYMVALSSGAELTKTQWQSMERIAPLAMRAVSEELGYGKDEYNKFREAVEGGTIAGKDFLKAFQKVGTEGSVANAARAMTESWSGLFANIQIAVTRMGADILDTLNETFKDASGRTLLQRLLGWDANGADLQDGIKSWINAQSDAIQEWIRSNPDKILDFFNTLKSIDVAGLLKGLAQGIMDIANVAKFFADSFGGNLRGFGRFMIDLNMLGRFTSVLGGVIRGLRFPLAWLATVAKFRGTGKGRGGGLFGKLSSLFGKEKEITEAESIGKAVTKASPTLISAFKNMAFLTGTIAIPFIGGAVVSGATKSAVKNFKETINLLKGIEWEDAKKVLAGMASFLGGSAVLGGIVGKVAETGVGGAALAYTVFGETLVGIITSIATGFGALNMQFIKDGIKNFTDSVKMLNELPDIEADGNVVDKVKNAVQIFNEVSDALNGDGENALTANDARPGNGIKGIGLFKRWGISNLSSSIGSIVSIAENLGKLANISVPEGATDKVQTFADQLAPIADKLNVAFRKPISSSFAQSSMKNIADSLIQLRRMAYHINLLSAVRIQEGTYAWVKKMIGYFKTISIDLNNAFTVPFSSGVVKSSMKNIANSLVQLRRMAYHINKLAGTDINESGFSEKIQQIKNALDELKGYSDSFELDIEVKLSDAFDNSVNEVINKIKEAKKKIEAYNGKTVRVRIPVSITFSVVTNVGAALARIFADKAKIRSASGSGTTYRSGNGWTQTGESIREATGGLIYRSRGGGVPNFRRRGTDTVPAMLTPGEYVHNKRAVNTFGIDFMRKVNNLDMKGAMNELMIRAGHMASASGRQSIVNNTYNNNQRVVINNSNNTGAGFTFKSASRFVGAF